MLMILVLVGILVTALAVSVWMWVQVQRESKLAEQRSAVPIGDTGSMQSLVDDPSVAYHQQALEQQRMVYEDRLREAKEEIEAVELRAQESERGLTRTLEISRGENEALKARIAELEASSSAANQDAAKIDRLIVENSAFRAQLAEASSESSHLKETLSRLEQENAQWKSSSSEIEESRKLVQQAKEEYQQQMDRAYAQMEELRTENEELRRQAAAGADADALKQAADELVCKVRELEMTQAIQAEKNEYLQYELTKSRAQVVGLERMCDTHSSLTVIEK